jgi:hypothetical protein
MQLLLVLSALVVVVLVQVIFLNIFLTKTEFINLVLIASTLQIYGSNVQTFFIDHFRLLWSIYRCLHLLALDK